VPTITVRSSYQRFCRLIRLAEERLLAGDQAGAAALSQVAAQYAFPGHIGIFAAPRLERLLISLGTKIRLSAGVHRRGHDRSKKRILHVLTYARAIGGDTRFVCRWIQEDPRNQHSVAVTRRGLHALPTQVHELAERTGGFMRLLQASPGRPLELALELRDLCQDMDLVALHLFPYDIVPVLALASECEGVKTLLLNHSDHTFWLGGTVAHSVVHLRKQTLPFLQRRRGLDVEKACFLPIPLAVSPSTIAQADAKRALGCDPDVLVLLTIASPFKYSAAGQMSFLELVTPVLADSRRTVLFAVGPEPTGAWQQAAKNTNGVIRPLGARSDNEILYAAADVYLDSTPFTSITSLLEAGSRGVPLLGFRSPNPDLHLLAPGAPGLDDAMLMTSDAESYRTMLNLLLNDASFRRESGYRVRTQILAAHTGPGWLKAVHDVYATAERSHSRGCLASQSEVFDATALDTALTELYQPVRGRVTPLSLLQEQISTWGYSERVRMTWRFYMKGLGLALLNFLPARTATAVRGLTRLTKDVLRPLARPFLSTQ
jgi:hypothetical protein